MMHIPQSYNGKRLVYSWNYFAKDGTPIGVVGRYQDSSRKKEVVPFFKRNGATWVAGIELNPRPLFGLKKLVSQPKDRAVFIVEGEKAAAALQGMGICAISSLGGSQAASRADWSPLSDYKQVYLLPDNDEPGEHYVRDVYRALSALGLSSAVKVMRLPGLPEGGDVVDWLQRFLPQWDGFTPIDESSHALLKENLRKELQKAEYVPESWNLAGLAGAESSVFEWGKPHEIGTKMLDVQDLKPELIPEPFRDWLIDTAYDMQTPPDFITVSTLVVTGSVIGAGCEIRPKQFSDKWKIVPNLWGAIIGRPSMLKSPSMNEPMSLLDRLQAYYSEQFKMDKVDYEFDAMTNQAMMNDVKSKLSKAAKGKGADGVIDQDEFQKLKADYIELKKNEESELKPRLFKTNEVSVQAMTELQKENPRGILVFRDELVGLLAKWEREDGAEERAYFLEAWNGDKSYTDRKIGRGLTHADNISISLLGSIQPDRLKRYLYQTMNGNNDGSMQRLQLAIYPDEPKDWQLIDTKSSSAYKQRAYEILKELAEMNFTQYGAEQGLNDKRPYFRFSEAGQIVFNKWLTELQIVKLKQEESPLMEEHLSKYRSLMPSLALIFHCIDIANGKASGPVSEQSARLAVQWCDYLESHARRIYAMAESPEYAAAVRLADKIKTKALPSPFTSKIVYDKGWYELKDKQVVEAACSVLIDEGWLMITRKPKLAAGGRPPLPDYHINPVFL